MGALAAFILVWVRTSSLMLATPWVFGQRGVPALARLGLGGLVAALLWPVAVGPAERWLQQAAATSGQGWTAWAAAVGAEAVAGLVMAFGVNTLFSAVLLAGQLVDLPMGFSVVNVIDPTLEEQAPLIGQFHMILATLVFFGVGGHHALLTALAESLRLLPPGAIASRGELLDAALGAYSQAFVLGLRIAAPVMAAMFVADVALAVVARAVPQMNVFVVGFPVKILLGFAALLVAMPAVVAWFGGTLGQGGPGWELVARLVQSLKPIR